MTRPTDTCWCDRHPRWPCKNLITAEDMLCDLCRPRDCGCLHAGPAEDALAGEALAYLGHVRTTHP